ncbi:restriction endonuclease subunit S [Ornithinibacillus salinisoli]|uniref:Restriction endonuclease subunit S n=1 Tax=Ornithinibacillus salinisoli TaxID=1848459 RepID=A0ABW4W4J9_9BACI
MSITYKKLGDIATYINGYAFKPKDWDSKGLPIIRIQNLTNTSEKVNYFNGEIGEKYIVKKGDILIAWSTSLGVYEWSGNNALLNQHIFKVVFDKEEINKQYFKFMVKSTLDRALHFLHGSTMKHITKKYFDNLLIPFPPLDVQQKIANTLILAQDLINKRKAQIKAIDQLIQSLFLEMFGDPVINNKHWDVKKLSETGELKRGMSKHRPRNAPELLGGPYPLIQTGDVSNSDIYIREYHQTYSELGLKQSKMWPAGTLCITIAANIAKTGILTFEACFPDSVVAYIPNKNMSNLYVHFWFKFLQRIIEAKAPESAQKNINLKILNNLYIPVPPIEKQKHFKILVGEIEQQKEIFNKSLVEMENKQNSIIQRAFRGELYREEYGQ